MNEDVDSLLSEKVSNLLLTWKVNSITVDNKSGGFFTGMLFILNETPPLIVSQDGKLSAATLKYNLLPQREYQF